MGKKKKKKTLTIKEAIGQVEAEMLQHDAELRLKGVAGSLDASPKSRTIEHHWHRRDALAKIRDYLKKNA